MTESKRFHTVRSLEKALMLLEFIGTKHEPIDLASMSREIGLPKTTVLRLLNTLVKRNFLSYNGQTKMYCLGTTLIYLGKIAEEQFNLTRLLHPFLVQIANEVQETASLVILEYDTAVYIDQVISPNIIRAVPSIGSHLQLYCTASGKLFLSWFSEEELENYLQTHPLTPFTSKTITNPVSLKNELRRIRNQGYSIDDEETEIGGFCIAVPVFDHKGGLSAVFSITGPRHRIETKGIESIATSLLEIAKKASEILGFKKLSS